MRMRTVLSCVVAVVAAAAMFASEPAAEIVDDHNLLVAGTEVVHHDAADVATAPGHEDAHSAVTLLARTTSPGR